MGAKTLSFYISPAIVCVQCIKLLPLLLSSNIKGQPAVIRWKGNRQTDRQTVRRRHGEIKEKKQARVIGRKMGNRERLRKKERKKERKEGYYSLDRIKMTE